MYWGAHYEFRFVTCSHSQIRPHGSDIYSVTTGAAQSKCKELVCRINICQTFIQIKRNGKSITLESGGYINEVDFAITCGKIVSGHIGRICLSNAGKCCDGDECFFS